MTLLQIKLTINWVKNIQAIICKSKIKAGLRKGETGKAQENRFLYGGNQCSSDITEQCVPTQSSYKPSVKGFLEH